MNLIKNERLGNFIKHIQYQPFPFENQRCFGDPKEMFLEDHFTIELAKYFYIGEERYMSEPIPRRLICTKSFSQEVIKDICEEKKETIVQDKNSIDGSSILRIHNVGRGLDLILLTEISNWEEIICHDDDLRYSGMMMPFFNEYSLNNKLWFSTITEAKSNTGGKEYVSSSLRLCE